MKLTTTDKLQLLLAASSAATLKVVASYSDHVPTTSYSGDSQFTASSGTTPVDIVSSPVGTGKVRTVLAISVSQPNATAATVTIRVHDGTDTWNVVTVTLAQFDTLQYSSKSGWQTVDSAGRKKVAFAASSIDASVTPITNITTAMFAANVVDTDVTLAANSDTRIASQKAVKAYVDTAVTGLLDLKGSTDASANPNYPAASKGDAYVITVAGKVGGASGKSVDVSDVYLATADNAGGTEASVGTSWVVLEHNLVGALLTANNLSELSGTASTARANLGLTIGTHVQAFDADLSTWAGIPPGTGVGTALQVAVGSAGAIVVNGGALGTPSGGNGTNITNVNAATLGGATFAAPGAIGGGTPAAGTFTTLVAGSTTSLLVGTAGSAVGNIGFRNATSGTATLGPPTGALGTYTVTLPNAASILPIFGQQVTFAGPTAPRTVTLPDAAFTVARTDAANVFIGSQTFATILATQASHITVGTTSTHPIRVVNQGNTDWTIGSDASGVWQQSWNGLPLVLNSLGNIVYIGAGGLVPLANDAGALGAAASSFSDLFLASGALISIANGNWVGTHSSGVFTVSTGDLRVTTAGTNAASVVTVGGTQTLTNKTLDSATIATTQTAVDNSTKVATTAFVQGTAPTTAYISLPLQCKNVTGTNLGMYFDNSNFGGLILNKSASTYDHTSGSTPGAAANADAVAVSATLAPGTYDIIIWHQKSGNAGKTDVKIGGGSVLGTVNGNGSGYNNRTVISSVSWGGGRQVLNFVMNGSDNGGFEFNIGLVQIRPSGAY